MGLIFNINTSSVYVTSCPIQSHIMYNGQRKNIASFMDDPEKQTQEITPVVRINGGLGTETEDCPEDDEKRGVPNWNGG